MQAIGQVGVGVKVWIYPLPLENLIKENMPLKYFDS